MNGKIVFFPLLPFSYDVNRRRDAKRLLAVLYFSSTRRIYWDIIFTSLFIIFFLFPIFLLSFMLSTFRLARRLLFPHILNNDFLLPPLLPRHQAGLLGKIRCNLTFFHSSEGISLVVPRSTWRSRCKVRYVYMFSTQFLTFFLLENV